MKRILATVLLLSGVVANAQNTSGVHGPVVDPDDRSMQYRMTYDPDSERFAHRLHYQQALNDRFRLRGIVQARDTGDEEFDFDYFRAELLWQLESRRPNHAHGLRFELRYRDEGRPGEVAVQWTNQWQFGDGYRARFIVAGDVEVGDGADDGIGLQTRAHITRRLSSGPRVGVEMFSAYGTTDDFRDFDEQSHQIGPLYSQSFEGGWSLFASYLFGVTDGAPDQNLRLWFGKSF